MKKIICLFLVLGVGVSTLLCVRGENQDMSGPEKNFEFLWKDFDQNYGIFGPKRVDWDWLYRVYRPKVTPQTTDEELFTIMSGMLKQLNDNHVRLRKEGRAFTSGCFADMRRETLPNGWSYSISYTLFTDQKGFCWEGIGVPPDLRIINTQEDIAQKSDKVLEFAMELIHAGGKL